MLPLLLSSESLEGVRFSSGKCMSGFSPEGTNCKALSKGDTCSASLLSPQAMDMKWNNPNSWQNAGIPTQVDKVMIGEGITGDKKPRSLTLGTKGHANDVCKLMCIAVPSVLVWRRLMCNLSLEIDAC